ncbi:Ionotropic receptor 142 [Blattella germanica]|nr:Ionotropic receptor 142 [Blattella germanica]
MKHAPWKNISLLLIMTTACQCQTQKSLSLLEATAVILGLQQYFHSGCVFFIHSAFTIHYELQDELRLLQLRKMLSRNNVATLAVAVETFQIPLGKMRCQKNRPVIVITNSGDTTKNALQQVAEKPGFSQPIWLLLLNTETSISTYFSKIYVPVDSEFLVAQRPNEAIQLTEVYQVNKDYPLQLNQFGEWSPNRGLIATKEPFCERRADLQGVTFKAITVSQHPYVFVTRFINGTSAVSGGFFGLVWFEFEQKLNFKTDYTALDTVSSGTSTNETIADAFSKVMVEIRNKNYDVALAALRFTSERFAIVDYSHLIHRSKFIIAIKPKDNEDEAWKHFFGPFQSTLWFGVLGCIVIIACCLSTFHYLGRMLAYPGYEDPKSYTLFLSVFYVFTMFCQQGHDTTPKSCACRLVYWLGYVTALVILAAYSATLISFLTIQSTEAPVRTIKALAQDKTFKLGMLLIHLKIVREDPAYGISDEIYNNMIAPDPANIPTTYLEGLQRVCKMKYAFMTSMEFVKQAGDVIGCNVAFLPEYSHLFNYAYVIRENSPYKRIINFLITKMQAAGVLQKLKFESWAANVPEAQNAWNSVSVVQVSPMLFILMGGMLASIAFLLMEMGFRRWKGQNEKRKDEWQMKFQKQFQSNQLLFHV